MSDPFDDDLHAAYERLDDAVSGSGHLGSEITRRVRQRRRRRTTGAVVGSVAAVAAVAAGLIATSADRTAPATTASPTSDPPSASPTSATPEPVDDTGLVCATDMMIAADLDFATEPTGGLSPLEAAQRFRNAENVRLVDRRHAIALRPDGTVYLELGLEGSPSTGYRVGTYESCDQDPVPLTAVTLDLGHCWVEPITVDGRDWDLLAEAQVGTGGPFPDGLTGTGDVRWWSTAHDRLRYVDDEGAELDFYPSDDPRTLQDDQRTCD